MNDLNPYQPPSTDSVGIAVSTGLGADVETADDGPVISTANTIVPRSIASTLDNIIAIVLGVMAAKAVGDDLPLVQVGLLVGLYISYYFLFEGLTSRTPGKLAAGLVITQFDGRRCSWRQSAIRTAFRLVEVNPILLGAMPAALFIIFSRNRQRLGDRMARTVVVQSRRLPKNRI